MGSCFGNSFKYVFCDHAGKGVSSIQYSSFMELYEFVTSMEFILLMFIVPAVTASAISGERERQTLDLMLTTRMSAGQIVTGKLLSASVPYFC